MLTQLSSTFNLHRRTTVSCNISRPETAFPFQGSIGSMRQSPRQPGVACPACQWQTLALLMAVYARVLTTIGECAARAGKAKQGEESRRLMALVIPRSVSNWNTSYSPSSAGKQLGKHGLSLHVYWNSRPEYLNKYKFTVCHRVLKHTKICRGSREKSRRKGRKRPEASTLSPKRRRGRRKPE